VSVLPIPMIVLWIRSTQPAGRNQHARRAERQAGMGSAFRLASTSGASWSKRWHLHWCRRRTSDHLSPVRGVSRRICKHVDVSCVWRLKLPIWTRIRVNP